MSLKENTYFLGLGCAGGKLHKEFISRGYKGAAVNGSEQDLKALGALRFLRNSYWNSRIRSSAR